MPPFSPCGRVVDFVRSCFEGSWRFYPSRPDILTRGFHYFADDATPAINGLHPFGSGVWNKDGGRYPDFPVGEVMSARRSYYDGEPPVLLPPDNQVGATADFAAPIPWPTKPPVKVKGYFHEKCFVLSPATVDFDPQLFYRPDIVDCCWQRVCARLLELLNDDTDVSTRIFREAFAELWWDDFVLFIGTVPYSNGNYALITGKTFQIVFLPGLQTWQELYGEVWHAGGPTRDFGQFGTSQRWFDHATQMMTELQRRGWIPAKATTFVGHSKGGVISSVMAVRAAEANAGTNYEVLTFGVPKPGDSRLVELRGVSQSRHVANAEDYICFLPPYFLQRDFPAFLRELFGAIDMGLWRHFPVYEILREGEQPTVGAMPLVPWETLLDLWNEWDAGNVPNPLRLHFLGEYVRRLAICCEDPVFPFTPLLWHILFSNADVRLQGFQGTGMPAKSIALNDFDKTGIPAKCHVMEGNLPRVGMFELGDVGVKQNCLTLDSRATLPRVTLEGFDRNFGDRSLIVEKMPFRANRLRLEGETLRPQSVRLEGSVGVSPLVLSSTNPATGKTLKLTDDKLTRSPLVLGGQPFSGTSLRLGFPTQTNSSLRLIPEPIYVEESYPCDTPITAYLDTLYSFVFDADHDYFLAFPEFTEGRMYKFTVSINLSGDRMFWTILLNSGGGDLCTADGYTLNTDLNVDYTYVSYVGSGIRGLYLGPNLFGAPTHYLYVIVTDVGPSP